MKLRLVFTAVFPLFPFVLFSQVAFDASSPSASLNSLTANRTVSVVGKVAVEGSSGPPENAAVVLQCGNGARTRVAVDRKGEFGLATTAGDRGPSPSSGQSSSVTSAGLNDCELYGEASGYVSDRLSLSGASGSGMVQAGTIILHRISMAQSFTVSATTLAAPERAKKAFEKGQEQEKKGKWAAACDYFKRAIEAYPRFALAWLELGKSQARQNNFTDAQESFHQAVAQDSRLMEGYVALAGLALEDKRWKDAADVTDRILQLAPDTSPLYWFLNAAANFNMGNLSRAEVSVTRGLRMDHRHQLPQMEYLYGLILASHHDYNGAIDHIKTYLGLAPHAPDAQAAQKRLTELEKLAESSMSASR